MPAYVEIECRACEGKGWFNGMKNYPAPKQACDGCKGAGVHLVATPAETVRVKYQVCYQDHNGMGGGDMRGQVMSEWATPAEAAEECRRLMPVTQGNYARYYVKRAIV